MLVLAAVRTLRCVSAVVALALTWSAHDAAAGGARPAAKVSLTPHLGVVGESRFVDGPVAFSDGGVDFIRIDPDTGILLGLEIGVLFRPKLRGVLALSYASADATYFEDNELRPDLDIDTIRIQPGVMVTVLQAGKTDLAFGGGLTIARYAIDNMIWNDTVISPGSTSIGLFGAGALDVALTPKVAFHTHLALELNRPAYGDLEDALAFADNEAGATVDHDGRTALVFVVGVAIGL